MGNFRVLILDDDELWRSRHELRLTKAGFDCYATANAKDAIKAGKTDPEIKFALVDEVLYVPPIPVREEERELQRWQGHGVIREIVAQRSDVQFIVVTAAPQLASEEQGGDRQVFLRETAKLRRQQGVIDIVHKVEIQGDPDGTYGWLIDLMNRSQVSATATVVTPKILIGLGFPKETHEAMAEQMEVRRRQYLPVAPLLKKVRAQIAAAGSADTETRTAKVLEDVWQNAAETAVFLEMPGSKKLDRLKVIKAASSAFQILSFLAQQSERKVEMVMRDADYKHATRRVKKTASDLPESDPLATRDFAFGYEEGQKGVRSGVQIEGKTEKNSPLKVAIHRLSKQLQKLNVGPANKLFYYNGQGYCPNFELGIVLYTVRAQRGRPG